MIYIIKYQLELSRLRRQKEKLRKTYDKLGTVHESP
jgi:hypothetical protein